MYLTVQNKFKLHNDHCYTCSNHYSYAMYGKVVKIELKTVFHLKENWLNRSKNNF